jgi:hypothetical protein
MHINFIIWLRNFLKEPVQLAWSYFIGQQEGAGKPRQRAKGEAEHTQGGSYASFLMPLSTNYLCQNFSAGVLSNRRASPHYFLGNTISKHNNISGKH